MADTGDLLGCDSWIPWPWEQSSDDVELLGVMEESLGERDGLVFVFLLTEISTSIWLIKWTLTAPYPAMNRICERAYSNPTFSAVCAYRTLDSYPTSLSVRNILLEESGDTLCSLWDLGDDQTTGDIGNPVSKLDSV